MSPALLTQQVHPFEFVNKISIILVVIGGLRQLKLQLEDIPLNLLLLIEEGFDQLPNSLGLVVLALLGNLHTNDLDFRLVGL